MENSRFEVNKNLAPMFKGGVIMDVTTPEQAMKKGPKKLNKSSKNGHTERSTSYGRIKQLP